MSDEPRQLQQRWRTRRISQPHPQAPRCLHHRPHPTNHRRNPTHNQHESPTVPTLAAQSGPTKPSAPPQRHNSIQNLPNPLPKPASNQIHHANTRKNTTQPRKHTARLRTRTPTNRFQQQSTTPTQDKEPINPVRINYLASMAASRRKPPGSTIRTQCPTSPQRYPATTNTK